MEVVWYVLEDALEHKDALGNSEVLEPGEFQRIRAWTGITHSEFNPSDSEPTHFYQICSSNYHEGVPDYDEVRSRHRCLPGARPKQAR
jgi:redox-sensitive bicupin YhaK (pirin superfamily)